MGITFDPVKDLSNQRKHGVSLSLAVEFEWDTAVEVRDIRRDYGEVRMVATGYIGPRLHVLVYVDRDNQRRVITLRKANSREEQRYAET